MSASKKREAQGDASSSKRVHMVDEEDSKSELLRLQEEMGLPASFGSTKNTHVEDNSKTASRGGRAPRQTRKARQYMNLKKPRKIPQSSNEQGQ